MIANLTSRPQRLAMPMVLWIHRMGLVAAVLLLEVTASPGSARPLPEARPTDSASIDIRVSVASRYGLGTTADSSGRQKVKHSAGAPFCIASNAGEPILPVMLLWLQPGANPEIGPQEVGNSNALLPCGASMRSVEALGRQDGAVGAEAVIIRPE